MRKSQLWPYSIGEKYSYPKWVIKFYVDMKVFSKAKEEQKNVLEDFRKDDLGNPAKEKKVMSVYKALSGNDLNLTSMSMYSGHAEPIDTSPCCSGIILNGDIKLNNNNVISSYTRHFTPYSESITTYHVPHHGSHENLIRPITEFPIKKSIICSGYKNKYGHPSHTIVRMYRDQGIRTKVLTEYDKNYYKTETIFS